MTELADHTCQPIPAGTDALSGDTVRDYLARLPGWELADGGKAIAKTFTFKNFYETMSFTNAVAHVANTQDHHPDLSISYKSCRVKYSTHTVGGVSENDIICAARIERL